MTTLLRLLTLPLLCLGVAHADPSRDDDDDKTAACVPGLETHIRVDTDERVLRELITEALGAAEAERLIAEVRELGWDEPFVRATIATARRILEYGAQIKELEHSIHAGRVRSNISPSESFEHRFRRFRGRTANIRVPARTVNMTIADVNALIEELQRDQAKVDEAHRRFEEIRTAKTFH